MGKPRSLEFVENREPQGCFGADVEALSKIDQDEINAALAAIGLYDPFWGVTIASDLDYDAAMIKGRIPVRYEEFLPHYDPKGDNKRFTKDPLDDSAEAIDERLQNIREAVRWDDHEGLLIAYPCRREEDQPYFLHFIAAIEPQDAGAELTVMDPSELPGVGGVFQKTEEEVREILTPKPELGIPVCGYLVKLDLLPNPPQRLPDVEVVSEVETDPSLKDLEAQLREVPALV